MKLEYDFKKLNSINFKSLEDIDKFIDIAQETNSTDESKMSREWWAIGTYALSKVTNNNFSLPLLIYRELGSQAKPDFWISFNEKTINIGFEVTYCCEEKYEQAKKICEKRNDGSYPINTAFANSDIKYFDDNFIQFLNEEIHGVRTFGDYSKTYTIESIIKSVEIKINKYKEYPKIYTLVVYVNLPLNVSLGGKNRNEISKLLSIHKEWLETFVSVELIWSKYNVVKLFN